jgi:beta-mannosidase
MELDPASQGSPLVWQLRVGDEWIPAAVPGTVAGALRDAGLDWEDRDLDASDWTFRTTFVSDGTAKVLHVGGIATVADVVLNGETVLHSETMFRSHDVPIATGDGVNELEIRCAALLPLLQVKRPRPRWKTSLIEHAQLRWFRTTFLGRMPTWQPRAAVVGPWRGVDVLDQGPPHVETPATDGVWWPHTHGTPMRHGTRTIEADTSDGDFRLIVNGVPIFARGGCWTPEDPVSLQGDPRRTLELARDAGMNMIRIPGTMPYESDAFFDACDELGILVWQDLALANLDPPDDEAFVAEVVAEVRELLERLARHPSLAVVCGGSEVEQQAAMLGLPAERRVIPLYDTVLPSLVAEVCPDVVWVRNSPSDGDLPFFTNRGVAHYFGVSGYRRPLEDARRADVRFASECLAFAVPGVRGPFTPPRDNGVDWDFADVREHYVREHFGEDRVGDLDAGRAVICHLMEGVFTEWRRPGSRCAGGLLLMLRDLGPGAGQGVLDSAGTPKAPWFALRRVLQPVALLATDEGLNGVQLHVVNDGPDALVDVIEVELFDAQGRCLETASVDVQVDAHGGIELSADALFGFRDLTYAYRFGRMTYDVVVATLRSTGSQVVHLPGGIGRPVEDIGLAATRDGSEVTVSTERFAHYVAVDGASDSWFHLTPGASRTIRVDGPCEVRAVNSSTTVHL